MLNKLFGLLLLLCFSLACGGGGGSSATTETTPDFKFKSSDTATTTGTWYATGFNLDGDELVPTKAKEIKLVANSDGTWAVTRIMINSDGSNSTFVSTSEGADTDTSTVQTFSYVAETRKIVITETFLMKATNQSHTVSMTLIKSGVPTEYVGTYALIKTQFNNLTDTPSEFVYFNMTLSADGTFVEKYRYVGSTEDVTSTNAINIGSGEIYIQNLVARQVGSASYNNGTFVYSTRWSSGHTSVSQYSKTSSTVSKPKLNPTGAIDMSRIASGN